MVFETPIHLRLPTQTEIADHRKAATMWTARHGDEQLKLTANHLVTLVAAFSIVLARLPVVTGEKSIVTPVVLGVFVLCIAWGWPRHRKLSDRAAAAAVLVFAALTTITVLRGSLAGVYAGIGYVAGEGVTYIVIVVFAMLLVTTATDARERQQRLVAVALAPAIYSVVNTLLYFFGVVNESVAAGNIGIAAGQRAELLSAFHIYAERIQFPLSSGITTAGLIAGAGLVSCLLLAWFKAARLLLLVPLGAACVFCLLLSDSRTPLLLVVPLAVFLIWNRRMVGVKWLVLAIPALPMFAIGAANIVNGSFSGGLSRSSGDIATLDNRTYIWSEAWNVLRVPELQQLWGWGANGHISSGLSIHYAYLFGNRPMASAYTTHNLVIQTVFDSGYIGLAILVWTLFVCMSRIADCAVRMPSAPLPSLAAILLICVLGGVSEVSPSYISADSLFIVLLIMGTTVGLSSELRSTTPDRSQATTPDTRSRGPLDADRSSRQRETAITHSG